MAKRKKKTRPTKRPSNIASDQLIDELAKIEDLIADSDLDIDSIVSGDYVEPGDGHVDNDSTTKSMRPPNESENIDDGIPVLDDLVMVPEQDTALFVPAPQEAESVLDDPSMIMRVDPVKPEPSVVLPPPSVVTEQVMEIIESILQNQLGSGLETHVVEELRERIQQALSDWLNPL